MVFTSNFYLLWVVFFISYRMVFHRNLSLINTMKGNYLAILHIISPALLNAAKGFMLLQESREHSSAHTQEKFPTTAFEDHVLDILELEEPPPVFIRRKRDDKVATFMAELYRELEDVDGGILSPTSGVEEWSIADRIVSVSPRDIQCSEGIIGLSFDYDDFPSSSASQLIASQLRIFLPEDLIFTRISIYRNKTGGLVVVDSTIVTSWQKTIGFNVTNIVSDWILGLTVPKLFIRVESGNAPHHTCRKELETFLIASFVDERTYIPQRRTRTRRSVEPHSEVNMEEREAPKLNLLPNSNDREMEGCHVQNLYLNFADIGWREWVIAPEGYSTNYCAGACSSDSPMHSKMNATNHAIVQTLVHLVDPKRAEEAKCAPIQLSPAKILFIDNHGNVVMRRYQDMTVQECGCL